MYPSNPSAPVGLPWVSAAPMSRLLLSSISAIGRKGCVMSNTPSMYMDRFTPSKVVARFIHLFMVIEPFEVSILSAEASEPR